MNPNKQKQRTRILASIMAGFMIISVVASAVAMIMLGF